MGQAGRGGSRRGGGSRGTLKAKKAGAREQAGRQRNAGAA